MKSQKQRQRGSAFILALMVLAILTVIGLSVSLITETEMSIGETEKIQNDQFFASEAGGTTAISGLLVTNQTKQINIVVPAQGRERSRADMSLGYDVLTSGLAMVSKGPLDMTKLNEGKESYAGYYYHTRTLTRRTAWPNDQEVPTCDNIEQAALGSVVVSNAFYFAPALGTTNQSLQEASKISDTASSTEYCTGGAPPGQSVFDFVSMD